MIAVCRPHYLIFHPARAKMSVMARAVTISGVQTYANNVFVDPTLHLHSEISGR
jgi:hypothetical protein